MKAIILDDVKRMLLVQMSYQNGWALPGGGIKRGEDSLEALRREIREELGIEITDLEKLATFENNAEGKIDTIELISCNASGQLKLSGEISKANWFGVDNLPELTPATRRRIEEFRKRNFSQAW